MLSIGFSKSLVSELPVVLFGQFAGDLAEGAAHLHLEDVAVFERAGAAGRWANHSSKNRDRLEALDGGCNLSGQVSGSVQ